MFSSAKVDIVTDSSGNATVYLSHGNNRPPNGFIVCIKYTPGTIDTGADLTITGEVSGIPVLAKSDAGTSTVFYYPRALANAVSDGAAATNSRTQVSDGIKLIGPDGTVILAGTLAFTADGIDINWTTVQNVRRYFNVTVWSGTPSIVGPVPQFEADDTTPPDGVVHFRDLSNPNGSPITSWGWQFGDGGESTEQHPEHSYMTPGTYHVTLTVSNANGSETLFKPNFVHYLASEHWLLGPYESRAVTRASVDRLYGDDPTASTYGYHEHALELDGLELDAQPDTDVTDGPVRPGKALIKLDWNGKKIVIVWPDGTTSEFSED